MLTGGATCPRTRGNFTGQHGNLASPGATAVETWGAVLRARALGLPEATPPRKFPADHTPVTIRTHQLRSGPGVSTRLRRAETALLSPPADRCQLNVKLGRHLGSPRHAGNLPTGPATQHMTIARRENPAAPPFCPPFTRAVLARRSPRLAPHFTPGRVNRWVLLTRGPTDLWPPGGQLATRSCRPTAAKHRSATHPAFARPVQPTTHPPFDHPDHQSRSTHPSSSTANHPPGFPTEPCPAPLPPQHERGHLALAVGGRVMMPPPL